MLRQSRFWREYQPFNRNFSLEYVQDLEEPTNLVELGAHVERFLKSQIDPDAFWDR